MITLAMDTAYKYLTLALFRDDELLASVSYECFKHQSEELFPQLEKLLEEADLDWKDIDQVVITDGPGSYTGVRIAMTVAKVLCTQFDLPLYTLSTLQIYGDTEGSVNVMLDARSRRAYVGHMEDGRLTESETILEEPDWQEFIEEHPGKLYGDKLMEEEPQVSDHVSNFVKLKPLWKRVENVHALVPRYLKESGEYKR